LVRVALSGLLVLSAACATRLAPPEVQVEEMDELSDELAAEGLDTMRGYKAHLRAVSDPLRLASTGLCGSEIVPYLGVILEVVAQRLPTPLDRAMRLRGIDVNPTVVSVIADSPAAEAGLRPNDVIRSFNGRRVISYLDLLDRLKADRRRPPRLEIKRAGERYEVTLPYRPACTLPAIVSPHAALSTWRFFSQVIVTRGLMDFVRSDDELAILIAHEMAHQIIGERRMSRDIEVRADRLSLELALRAGYDIRGAVDIWERLAVERPWMITTHPTREKNSRLQVYHGHVAARTLLMPGIIAELESKYPPTAAASGDSRRNSIQGTETARDQRRRGRERLRPGVHRRLQPPVRASPSKRARRPPPPATVR